MRFKKILIAGTVITTIIALTGCHREYNYGDVSDYIYSEVEPSFTYTEYNYQLDDININLGKKKKLTVEDLTESNLDKLKKLQKLIADLGEDWDAYCEVSDEEVLTLKFKSGQSEEQETSIYTKTEDIEISDTDSGEIISGAKSSESSALANEGNYFVFNGQKVGHTNVAVSIYTETSTINLNFTVNVKQKKKKTIIEETWGVSTMSLSELAQKLDIKDWKKHAKKKKGDILEGIEPVETKIFRHVKYVEFYIQTYTKKRLCKLIKDTEVKELPTEHQRAIGCIFWHGWITKNYAIKKGVPERTIDYLIKMDRSL